MNLIQFLGCSDSEDAAKTDLAIEALTEHAENDKEYNRVYLGVKE